MSDHFQDSQDSDDCDVFVPWLPSSGKSIKIINKFITAYSKITYHHIKILMPLRLVALTLCFITLGHKAHVAQANLSQGSILISTFLDHTLPSFGLEFFWQL